jgi:hypothetical protein
MSTRMQQRRGTAAQWISTNSGNGPILAAGEIGFESDTNKFKIGDGVNHWVDLTYFTDAESAITAISNIIDGAPAALDTLNELAAALGDDPNFLASLPTTTTMNQAIVTHKNTTTDIHGISDTAALATKTYADGKASSAKTDAEQTAATALSNHATDTTNIHGIANTSLLATLTDADTAASNAINTHNSDTTSVHGIADTSLLATKTYADGKASDAQTAATTAASTALSAHETDTTSVHGITDTAALATKTYADNAVSTHEADTTSVHGIANTANIVFTTDSGTVTSTMIANGAIVDADINASAAIAQSKISGLTTDLAAKAPLADPTFTGTVVLPSTTSIGNVSATEIGYVDGVTSSIQTQLTARLPLAGGTMTGALTLSGAPTSDLHAATKLYVDNVTAGINFHEAVHAASVNNLAVIYNNGTSGVGATLTADTNRAFSTIDGESVVLGQRVLIKNQTDEKQNGIYTLTTAGSVSVPWVLTRATDADNNPTGEMKTGDFVFVINGTVNASVGYINNSTANPIVIGTDNISYTEFSAGKTVAAGSGLTEATPGTISVATGGVTSAMIADGTIVDGDINASAAIAQSKISGLTSDLAAKAPTANPTFTGTVTVAASGVAFTDGTQTKEGVPSRTPIIQKTDSYTLSALTERDSLIEVAKSTATTITIPANSTVAYPVGTSIDILQTSTGQVTIAGAGGVTVNATPGLKLRTQWSSATLFKRATDTWVVYGDLTA